MRYDLDFRFNSRNSEWSVHLYWNILSSAVRTLSTGSTGLILQRMLKSLCL